MRFGIHEGCVGCKEIMNCWLAAVNNRYITSLWLSVLQKSVNIPCTLSSLMDQMSRYRNK